MSARESEACVVVTWRGSDRADLLAHKHARCNVDWCASKLR